MSNPWNPVRTSYLYAELDGRPFRFSKSWDWKERKLLWKVGEGPVPDGFDLDQTRSLGTRPVESSELDRVYKLTVTCMYRGGGPFHVWEVGRENGEVWVRVEYLGDNREWALAQPGIVAMPEYAADRTNDVWGTVKAEDLEYVREDIENVRIPRRRRKKATTNAGKTGPGASS